MQSLPESIFSFLTDLKQHNDRDWMSENKTRYKNGEVHLKKLYETIKDRLNEKDKIEKVKVFRINRDIRFSKDKTPYNIHRSASFSRAGLHRRGGYYLRIEAGNSRVAGGFFNPNPQDLLRIRKEFALDDNDIREILEQKEFKKAFGGFSTLDQVKTAPKGFNKEHSAIDLIRNKSFVVSHAFTNQEVLAPDFADNVIHHYELLRPFFDYISDVLTTDLNGEPLI